jgi:hypothetical protein
MSDAAKLCRIVEGVEFTVVEQGIVIRALILRDALESFFGAGDTPESWMRAYLENQDTIDCAAADRFRRDLAPALVLLRGDRPGDFRHLATSHAGGRGRAAR